MSTGEVRVAIVHLDSAGPKYAQTVRAGKHVLTSDEPVSRGGGDAGPAPYAFVLAGLAACTSITLRMYADRKGWDLGPVHVDAVMLRDGESDRIVRTIRLGHAVTPEQRARLAEIADKTPVTKTLLRNMPIETTIE